MKMIREESISGVSVDQSIVEALVGRASDIFREMDERLKAMGIVDGSDAIGKILSEATERVATYESEQPGVVGGLVDMSEQLRDHPDMAARVLDDGYVGFVTNWDELERQAPWALDCFQLLVRTDQMRLVIEDVNTEHEQLLDTDVGEITWSDSRYGCALSWRAAKALFEDEHPPVLISRHRGRNLWVSQERLFSTSREFEADDIDALIVEYDQIARRALEKAHARKAMGVGPDSSRRNSIPREVRLFVWQRDGGRCVACSSQDALEFDHIIPLVLGGSSTERNLQLLCELCNRSKGGSL